MNIRISFIIFALVLSVALITLDIPQTSAEVQTLGTFKQNECISLTQLCADCTFVNITSVILPNSTIILRDTPMTKQGVNYNYSFCNTDKLGTYIYNTLGNPASTLTTQPVSFEVTPTGYTQSTSQSIGSLAFLGIVLFLTVLFGFMGFKFFQSDKLWVFGALLIGMTFLFVVYDTYLAMEFYLNNSGYNNTSQMPETLFYIFMTVLTAGLMASAILLVTKWKEFIRWWKSGKNDDGNEFDNIWQE